MVDRRLLLNELTREELKRIAPKTVAIFPAGATEQHGPHLTLDTDTYDAEYLAIEAAKRVSRPRPIVLPGIPYGVAYHHMDFPGTLAVSPDVLSRLVVEVGLSAARHGITKLVIVNGHGGNVPALRYAAQLDDYRAAAAKLLRVDPELIERVVYFVTIDRAVPFTRA